MEDSMNIILKSGDSLTVAENATAFEVAQAISEGLARNAVCAKVNGELVDLSQPLKEGDSLEIVTLKDKEGLQVYRHTCAHVLAQALKTVYPTCKLSIGPVIENGFYYDIDFVTPITQADLAKVKAKCRKSSRATFPSNALHCLERKRLPS
jgi:threonyl-tRNA synthetase